VAKKHEVFLARMSLDVKRAEILKLEEKATRKERALQESQDMLDEDRRRFEELLQSREKKQLAAMKNAEEMSKKKLDKLHRIKQLKCQLSALQSDIAKLREQKDDCMGLKSFLEVLMPQEWKDAKNDEKRERQSLRKKAWVNSKLQVSNEQMRLEIQNEEKALEEKMHETLRGRRRQKTEIEEEQKEREKELEARKRRIRKRYPTRDAVEAQYQSEFGDNSSSEDMPLYFKEPRQLIDVFTSMEEANLFLIQNSQDIEKSLEECQQQSLQTQHDGDLAREKMKFQIAALERQIQDERSKSLELRQKLAQQDSCSDQEDMIRSLCEKAEEVYSACGYEVEREPDTLQMLAAAEAKIEEFLGIFKDAEDLGFEKVVDRIEREAESNRRAMEKREKKEQADRKNQERVKASLRRSQTPIRKKTGKMIMYRSPPVNRTQRIVEEDSGYEEAVQEHKVFGIWTGKDGNHNPDAPVKDAPAKSA